MISGPRAPDEMVRNESHRFYFLATTMIEYMPWIPSAMQEVRILAPRSIVPGANSFLNKLYRTSCAGDPLVKSTEEAVNTIDSGVFEKTAIQNGSFSYLEFLAT